MLNLYSPLSLSAVLQIAKKNVKAAPEKQMQLQGFMIGVPHVCMKCLHGCAGLCPLATALRRMAADCRAALMMRHPAGNPWTDADIDNRGVVDFMWNHAVISDKAAGECMTSLEPQSRANSKLSTATLDVVLLDLRSQRWQC